MRKKKLQCVWPRDGPKGSDKRGFWGRLNNVVTGRGPDVFLQAKGSKAAIPVERWSNWDSHYDSRCHLQENMNSHSIFGAKSRGAQRYDPYSRRYETFVPHHDWLGVGMGFHMDPNSGDLIPGEYPRFTQEETWQMQQNIRHRGQLDPLTMGSNWSHFGPKRFRPEHDWFWQHAHRIGHNRREGIPCWVDADPLFSLAQQHPDDLNRWCVAHGL